jgi:hypothetical protein
MAYSQVNPPKCLVPGVGGGPAIWAYQSTDVHTDVDASGYFTNGGVLGMKAGDIVFVQDTDTGTHNTTIHSVQAVTAGAATISAAVLA